jgi:hypothetical protein
MVGVARLRLAAQAVQQLAQSAPSCTKAVTAVVVSRPVAQGAEVVLLAVLGQAAMPPAITTHLAAMAMLGLVEQVGQLILRAAPVQNMALDTGLAAVAAA